MARRRACLAASSEVDDSVERVPRKPGEGLSAPRLHEEDHAVSPQLGKKGRRRSEARGPSEHYAYAR